MKIGVDCRLWNETGVGRYIRNLILNLQILDKKNDYILFVLPKDYDRIISHFSSLNFHLVKTDIKWHTFEEQVKLPKILNRESLDLMHFPYHSVPIFYNRSFVLTIHDLIPYNFPTGKASALPFFLYWLKFFVYKYVLRNATKKAKRIIAVSNATKQEIIDHLKVDPQKVVVIYEGVDQKITNPKLQIPNKLQITNYKLRNAKYLLYVGNAYPHKNTDRLLEAFKILNSDIGLVFVGKEDYFYKRLKTKVEKLKLSKKIIFLQNVRDEELSSLYQNALALVMPSLMEGFGLPALEAMANNCLVLASDIPSLKEICSDAAIYFNPCNVEDISEKMKVICSNDSNHRSEKIKKGLERVKLFSWEKMTKETLAIYNSLDL